MGNIENKNTLDSLIAMREIAARILSKLQISTVNGYEALNHAQDIQWMSGFLNNLKDQIRAIKDLKGSEVIDAEIVQPSENVGDLKQEEKTV